MQELTTLTFLTILSMSSFYTSLENMNSNIGILEHVLFIVTHTAVCIMAALVS